MHNSLRTHAGHGREGPQRQRGAGPGSASGTSRVGRAKTLAGKGTALATTFETRVVILSLPCAGGLYYTFTSSTHTVRMPGMRV